MTISKVTALDKEVGNYLCNRRRAADLNANMVADRLGWDGSKISRIENGLRVVSPDEAAMYLVACGAGQSEVDEVLDLMAEEGRYRAIDHAAQHEGRTLSFHERSAVAIEGYESTCIPPLLRIDTYARALLVESGVRDGAVLERSLDSLALRQGALTCTPQPRSAWYIHENVLHNPTGDDRVMNEQLLHLTFLGAEKHCTIRVVPRSAKGAGLVKAGFENLTFADMRPVVILDLETHKLLLDQVEDTIRYRKILKRLDSAALDEHRSAALIAQLADSYDSARLDDAIGEADSPDAASDEAADV